MSLTNNRDSAEMRKENPTLDKPEKNANLVSSTNLSRASSTSTKAEETKLGSQRESANVSASESESESESEYSDESDDYSAVILPGIGVYAIHYEYSDSDEESYSSEETSDEAEANNIEKLETHSPLHEDGEEASLIDKNGKEDKHEGDESNESDSESSSEYSDDESSWTREIQFCAIS